MLKASTSKTCLYISLLWLLPFIWYLLSAIFTAHSANFYFDVSNIYQAAGQRWVNGLPLYNGTGFGFVYFPTSAAIMSVFAYFPMNLFAFSFRIISVGVMLCGLYCFSAIFKAEFSTRIYFFTTLISVILCQSCIQEGQMHLLIAGLALLGLAAIANKKWYLGAFYIALSVALKPTAIVIALLAFALYPKLRLRFIIILAAIIALSFLLQNPHYVWQQYIACLHSFQHSFKYDGINPAQWATLFGAFAFYFQHSINPLIAFSLRIIFAFAVLVLCYLVGRRFSPRQMVVAIFILGMTYLMLFNSRTENNDYVMAAPALGLTLAYAVSTKRWLQLGFHVVILLLLLMNWNLCHLLGLHTNIWLAPTVLVAYAVYVVPLLLGSKRVGFIMAA